MKEISRRTIKRVFESGRFGRTGSPFAFVDLLFSEERPKIGGIARKEVCHDRSGDRLFCADSRGTGL